MGVSSLAPVGVSSLAPVGVSSLAPVGVSSLAPVGASPLTPVGVSSVASVSVTYSTPLKVSSSVPEMVSFLSSLPSAPVEVSSSAPMGGSSLAPVGGESVTSKGEPSKAPVAPVDVSAAAPVDDPDLIPGLMGGASATERESRLYSDNLTDEVGDLSLDGTFVLSSSQNGLTELPHNQVVDGIRLPTEEFTEQDTDNISSIWEDSYSREFSDQELKDLAERLNSKRTKRPFEHVISPRTESNLGSETGPQEKKK